MYFVYHPVSVKASYQGGCMANVRLTLDNDVYSHGLDDVHALLIAGCHRNELMKPTSCHSKIDVNDNFITFSLETNSFFTIWSRFVSLKTKYKYKN